MTSLQCHSQVVAVVLRQGTIHADRQLWALPPETAPIFGGIHSHEINEYFDAGKEKKENNNYHYDIVVHHYAGSIQLYGFYIVDHLYL